MWRTVSVCESGQSLLPPLANTILSDLTSICTMSGNEVSVCVCVCVCVCAFGFFLFSSPVYQFHPIISILLSIIFLPHSHSHSFSLSLSLFLSLSLSLTPTLSFLSIKER